MTKPTHFDVCIDENCERKKCVDRRNPPTTKPIAGVEFDEMAVHEQFNVFDAAHDFEASEFDFTEGARWQFSQCRFEIERLRAKRHIDEELMFGGLMARDEMIDQLQSENARLRTALTDLFKASEFALEEIGIYPVSVHGGENPYEERTPEMNAHNELAMNFAKARVAAYKALEDQSNDRP